MFKVWIGCFSSLLAGVLIGCLMTHEAMGPAVVYTLNGRIQFSDKACHETTRIRDGTVEKSWSAVDIDGQLYFSSFNDDSEGCIEFYKLFHQAKP